jgi:hypothetical protein
MKLVITVEELKARVETKCQREPAKRAVVNIHPESRAFVPYHFAYSRDLRALSGDFGKS